MCFGDPLWSQSLYRDVLGRARSVQTFWGNPESAANRNAPWRGYGYDGEGRLTTVFEQEGATDPVFPDFSRQQITDQDVFDFVGDYTGTEPIQQVDWERESSVGGLTNIQELGGVSRWRTTADRSPGHQLDEISVDNASYVIAHDAHGRVTEGAGATYDYGPRGRLLAASTGGLSEEYLYDADGRLVRVVDGKLQILAYDGDHMIAAIEPGVGVNWEAVWGATTDQLIEYERFELGASGRFVPITDHRNSIVGWWDADRRQMDDVIEYTPHGRIRLLQPDGTERCVEQGTGTDCVRQWLVHPFGFASAYRSEFAGIVHMRNRWYDPKLGQFLTHDPLGFIDSYNPYAYVGFDPINFFDPYGLAKQLALNVSVSCERDPRCAKASESRDTALRKHAQQLHTQRHNASVERDQDQQCRGAACSFTKQHFDIAFDIAVEEIITGYYGGILLKGGIVVIGAGAKAAGKFDELYRILDAVPGLKLVPVDELLKRLPLSQRRAYKSYQRQRDAHIEKLEKYRSNPDAFDNQGHLKAAGEDTARRARIIGGRIRHLKKEIESFEQNMTDILQEAVKVE